ncbi:hypothetical protein ACSLGG_17475 [Bacillus mycoides]|uniref:hypothetical protein n=1 Tax=Bacillus mycoides TaxID=1405 RepID=UPI003F74F6EA
MQQAQTCVVSVTNGQELIWHIAEVKHGNGYRFEIHKVIDDITVYFINKDLCTITCGWLFE